LKHLLYFIGVLSVVVILSSISPGCAQIGMPTGGKRDSLPPRLLNASPALKSTSFSGNKITLTFNEYIEVKEVQKNVLVSPLPKTMPFIDYNRKTVTIKLKDTLLPNTTYAINFGNAIVDVNESNPLGNFTYIFSTGPAIDSFELGGKVLMAETGVADSTLVAMLYRNADDSAVRKRRPDYIANISGDGSFKFVNLPAGVFKLYALKDGDGGRTYNARFETFAFADVPVTVSSNTAPVTLYAYALEKDTRGQTSTPKKNTEKKLKYGSDVTTQVQELLANIDITFNKPLQRFEPSLIVLTDTNYNRITGTQITIDSTRTKITLKNTWTENTAYRLLLDSAAVMDSTGLTLAKSDTLKFTTKKESAYGSVVLRFTGLDLSKNPVLLFVTGDEVKESYPLTGPEWKKKLFYPGDYELRILYDENRNGKWDPGNYELKQQPELVVPIKQRLAIRANWDNERDIKL